MIYQAAVQVSISLTMNAEEKIALIVLEIIPGSEIGDTPNDDNHADTIFDDVEKSVRMQ